MILHRILSDQGSLTTELQAHQSHPDLPLIQEICFGVCRNYHQLDAALKKLMERPLRARDQSLYFLLLVGLYQLYYMRIPNHAVVNETVAATRTLKKAWAKGLINGVLRRCTTEFPSLDVLLEYDDPEIHYCHPLWFIDQLKSEWPSCWQQILDANNKRAPMTLRVNLARQPRDDYLEKLRAASIGAQPGNLAPSSVYLDKPLHVQDIPGFMEGEVSVQDEASQLVASLLNLNSGQRVLDACAAPGGKTGQILESEQSLQKMIVLDRSASRLKLLQENLQRLGAQAETLAADASQLESWWDGMPFDRILLDAPCSGSGVIRRHPDIKLLRQQDDLTALVSHQLQLLQALWACLSTGGQLLYTTCSVLRLENEVVIQRFLESNSSAKHHAITADWGVECRYGRQLLPREHGSDGFYFACVEKT